MRVDLLTIGLVLAVGYVAYSVLYGFGWVVYNYIQTLGF
jgi:hypothetical protein